MDPFNPQSSVGPGGRALRGGFLDPIRQAGAAAVRGTLGITNELSKTADTWMAIIGDGISRFFGQFNTITVPQQQLQIGQLYSNGAEQLRSAINNHLSTNPVTDKDFEAFAKVMEKPHENSESLMKALEKEAPKVHEVVRVGFSQAKHAFQEKHDALDDKTKEEHKKMVEGLKQSQTDLKDVLNEVHPAEKEELGKTFHLLMNMHLLSQSVV